MTTPGATEAVTPEQRARDLCYEAWEKNWHFHQLEPTIAQALREAEANALRRCARIALDHGCNNPSCTECVGCAIEQHIRSLLPKEEGT